MAPARVPAAQAVPAVRPRPRLLRPVPRVVGVHKLLLLNFYPFLQKYITPHQRDVTQVGAP